jgi:PST family polysaccharide transporter
LTRTPLEKEKILGTAFFLKFFGGVITLFLAVGLISLLRPGDDLIRAMVLILTVGTVFQAFGTIDFWFQSKIQVRYSVWARNVAYIIVSLGRVVLIMMRAPLIAFVWMLLSERVLVAIGLALAYRIKVDYLRTWQRSIEYAKKILSESWPLMLSGISISIYMNIDKVMLGQMLNSRAVGIYSVATKVSFMWFIVPSAFVKSIFPLIVKGKGISEKLYYMRIRKLFNLIVAFGLPIVILLTVFSSRLIIFLYGNSYAKAGPVLAIYIWSIMLASLGVASTTWIITEGRTKFALVAKVCGLIINILLNLILIPLYREIGAAIATVVSHVVTDYVIFYIYPPSLKIGRLITRAFAFGIIRDWKRDYAE